MKRGGEQEKRMVRKQTYLLPEQDRELKELAKVKRVTEAEVIREALDHFIKSEKKRWVSNPLLGIVGLCSGAEGPQDGSVNHDRYLYSRP